MIQEFPDFVEVEINKMVGNILAQSSTYDEALKNAEKTSLVYRYGKMGSLIDSAVRKRITAHALKNEINREILS